ncbi:MAG: GntR family transcriptional regulator [Bifidobacteriaceae bacterium]|jgi:GntR family transcriptional regulator|nr:GntR family transcriptional regulator [Bifidobacteriaceae bacterium]
MPDAIDRDSPLPYYHQLKLLIMADIETHGLTPGDRVASDRELGEQYGVARSVVRQALLELELEGLITRRKGQGTFVAQPKTDEGLARSLQGLYEDVTSRGSTIRTEVLSQGLEPADPAVAKTLETAIGDSTVRIERLREVDGEPWVHTVAHVPRSVAPGLENEPLTDRSLYAVLHETYAVKFASARRSIEAAMPSPETAKLLRMPKASPVLVLRSVMRDPAGRPVEAFVAHHRGDRARFTVELGGGAAGLIAASCTAGG